MKNKISAKKEIVSKKNIINESKILYLLYFLLALFVYEFIINAWVGDDAYITFRTVDNFVNGYGLTWNTSERVQAYTHPLWMFIHSIFYAIIGNIYITTIFLSFVFSFMAVYLMIFKIAANKINAITGAVLLILSKIFIDYTSSGLENPLTYFLAILFLIYYFKENEVKRKIFTLSLITAIALLNRMDTVLLFLPALIYVTVKNWNFKQLLYIIYGFLPFIIWEIFSIIYYGFPFPNTYYAKLNTGIPLDEYIRQGISYYEILFSIDLMSGIIIFLGLILITIISIKYKSIKQYLPLLIGILLYLFYIMRIGGDFMAGRFFAVIFLIIVSLLIKIYPPRQAKYLLIYFLTGSVLLSFFTSYHPLISSAGFGSSVDKNDDLAKRIKFLNIKNGINEERGVYYPYTGLLKIIKNGSTEPKMQIVDLGKKTRHSQYHTIVQSMIGMIGFYAGPNTYIIDQLALPDPFLSKLKSSENPDWEGKWRIGHFYRKMPAGYFKTIETGVNQIESESLNMFYEKIKLITRNDIFSIGRFSEIWKMNTGHYDEIVDIKYKSDDEPKLFAGDEQSIKVFNLRMGNYYFQHNENSKSLAYYKQLLSDTNYVKKTTMGSFLFYQLGKIYYETKKYDSALYYIYEGFRYIESKEKYIIQMDLLSRILIAMGNIEKSMEVMRQMLIQDPNNIQALNNLAMYYYKMGNSEWAIRAWRKTISINPNIYESYQNLYICYFDKKMYDSAAYFAFKSIEKGGKVNPQILEFLKKYKK